MKHLLVLAALATLPAFAHATLNVDQIKLIFCTDDAPTATANLFFTNLDEATEQYVKKPGSIPYDYGNLISPNRMSGQMHERQGGLQGERELSLVDDYDNEHPSLLEIRPTQLDDTFRAVLSGFVELDGRWQSLPEHAMICKIQMK